MTTKVGFLGGGQLARLMTTPALELGFGVNVLEEKPDCPTAQMGAHQIIGGWKDAEGTMRLVNDSDYVGIDVEHIRADVLLKLPEEQIAKIGTHPETLAMIQDKYEQHRVFAAAGIPTASFVELVNIEEARAFMADSGDRGLMLKSKRMAYDGKGNTVASNQVELGEFFDTNSESIAAGYYYAEQMVELAGEVSSVVARDKFGNVSAYPLVDSYHKDSILNIVVTPSQQGDRVQEDAREIAHEVMRVVKGAGVFGIEMLVDKDGNVMLNEVAPRVHNTGHITTLSAQTGQFENYVRAITGFPLGGTEPIVFRAAMINILGDMHPIDLNRIGDALRIAGPNAEFKWYGKAFSEDGIIHAAQGRKLGHVNMASRTTETPIELYNRAMQVRDAIKGVENAN